VPRFRRLGIVIPAFNEALSIARIVKQVKRIGIPIIVDDGSIDGTGEIARNSGAEVITQLNSGYDAALNVGFLRADELDCNVVLTLDADGQHDPNNIIDFMNHINLGFDIVVGSRQKKQRVSEYIYSFFMNLKYGVNDPLSGMKAYRMDLYKRLGYFDSYSSVGTELLHFALAEGYRVKTIPIVVFDRKGKSRFGSIISSNFKIFRAMILGFCKF